LDNGIITGEIKRSRRVHRHKQNNSGNPGGKTLSTELRNGVVACDGAPRRKEKSKHSGKGWGRDGTGKKRRAKKRGPERKGTPQRRVRNTSLDLHGRQDRS